MKLELKVEKLSNDDVIATSGATVKVCDGSATTLGISSPWLPWEEPDFENAYLFEVTDGSNGIANQFAYKDGKWTLESATYTDKFASWKSSSNNGKFYHGIINEGTAAIDYVECSGNHGLK